MVPADLLIAPDHRVDLAVTRAGEVAGIFLERVIGVLRRRAVGRAALAQRVDRRVEVLRREPRPWPESFPPRFACRARAQQQALDRHHSCRRLFPGLLGGVEHPRGGRRQIDLPAPAPETLGILASAVSTASSASRELPPARSIKPRRALPVVEQDLEQMLGANC